MAIIRKGILSRFRKSIGNLTGKRVGSNMYVWDKNEIEVNNQLRLMDGSQTINKELQSDLANTYTALRLELDLNRIQKGGFYGLMTKGNWLIISMNNGYFKNKKLVMIGRAQDLFIKKIQFKDKKGEFTINMNKTMNETSLSNFEIMFVIIYSYNLMSYDIYRFDHIKNSNKEIIQDDKYKDQEQFDVFIFFATTKLNIFSQSSVTNF
jgi:hypothetical protein